MLQALGTSRRPVPTRDKLNGSLVSSTPRVIYIQINEALRELNGETIAA